MTNVQKRSLLTFVELLPPVKGQHQKALYKCECGNIKELFMSNVKRLHTISCGCIKTTKPINVTHGLRKHPLYRVWSDIKTRCTNPNRDSDSLYRGKGVRMCEEWLNNPDAFIKWALENGWEKGLQVDKDKKANAAGVPALIYSPEWCSIVSRKENSNERGNNRKIEFNGEVKNIMQWADFFGVSKAKFWYRMRACDFDIYAYFKKWGNKT